MIEPKHPDSRFVGETWRSFRLLPMPVILWMMCVLLPVNVASLWFLDQPTGGWVALFSCSGLALNMPVVVIERGISKLIAVVHVVPWTGSLLFILFFQPEGLDKNFEGYLAVLFVVNFISLVFDYRDAYKWIKGDRAVLGRG